MEKQEYLNRILSGLNNKEKYNILLYNSITSTNSEVLRLGSIGEMEWTVAAADLQTEGRGRLGRPFESPYRTGVYLSVLLRPQIKAEDSVYITVAAAVAAARTIEIISDKKAYIKWVNDIYVNSRKVCGILTESKTIGTKDTLEYAVLGVGVNIAQPENGFSDEVREVAGTLFDACDDEKRAEFICNFLNIFSEYYDNGFETAFDEYRERSNLIGEDVEIVFGENHIPAKVMDINNKCALVVKLENGETTEVNSGEVRIRRIER